MAYTKLMTGQILNLKINRRRCALKTVLEELKDGSMKNMTPMSIAHKESE